MLGDGRVISFESCAVHFEVIACTLSESDRFQRVVHSDSDCVDLWKGLGVTLNPPPPVLAHHDSAFALESADKAGVYAAVSHM